MHFTLRSLLPSDTPQAAALIRAAFAAQPVVLEPPPSALGVTAEALADHLARAGGLVAAAADQIIGVVLWEMEKDALHVSRLAVAAEARRQGVAHALLVAAEAEARRLGQSRLWLGTRLALAGNRRLFGGSGFVERRRHTHPGYAEPTWVEMEKRLD